MKNCVTCGAQLADNAQFCNVCGTPMKQSSMPPAGGQQVQPMMQQNPALPAGGQQIQPMMQQNPASPAGGRQIQPMMQQNPVPMQAQSAQPAGGGQPLPRIAYTSSSMQPQLFGEKPKKSPAKPIIITLASLLAVAAAAVLIIIFVMKPGSNEQDDDPSGEVAANLGDQPPTLTPGEDGPTMAPGGDESAVTPGGDEPAPTPDGAEPTKTPEEEMIPDGSLRVVVHDRLRADMIISHSLLSEKGEFYVTFRMPGKDETYEVGFRRQMREIEVDADLDGVTDGTSEILCEEGFLLWNSGEDDRHADALECIVDGDRVTLLAEFAETTLSEKIDFREVTEYTLTLDRSEDRVQRAFTAGAVAREYALSEIPVTDSEFFVYTENEEGGIVITGYHRPEQYREDLFEMAIPEEIDGKTVVAIGDQAFDCCLWLRAVWIPDSVSEIGHSAFSRCRNLARVRLPEGLTALPNGMFSCGFALEEVELPKTMTRIGNDAFYECERLAYLKVPDGVTEIGAGAFVSCKNLTDIYLPRELESIGYKAFAETGLILVMIPENVTDMGAAVFSDCKELKYVALPENLTEIGERMFSECVKLEKIEIPESVTKIGSGAFYGCASIEEIVIPDGVEEIADETFCRCTSLTVVKFPKGLKYVGTDFFRGTKALEKVLISSEPDINEEFISYMKRASGNGNFEIEYY